MGRLKADLLLMAYRIVHYGEAKIAGAKSVDDVHKTLDFQIEEVVESVGDLIDKLIDAKIEKHLFEHHPIERRLR